MDTVWFDSDDPAGEGWDVRLEGLVATYRATHLDEVEAVLSEADRAARDGRWAAVAVAYEAAPAFEPRLRRRTPATARQAGVIPRSDDDPPLVWVGIYDRAHARAADPSASAEASADRRSAKREGWSGPPGEPEKARPTRVTPFVPAVGVHEFAARVREAQESIRAGDTYQVNLTFPLRAADVPDPDEWYPVLRHAQQARYCARVDIGSHLVLSFSPELFFTRRGGTLTAQPMKGTARRGRWLQEDKARALALATSEKERAENVMIVDLLRNDIGRVARPGTVRVPDLFHLERYPTLWQMTSRVEARVPENVPLASLFRALFPCGSVTGAPKVRTMEIIAALERQPRGVYTGAIGFVRPGGDCVFSVAIRTIVINRATGVATLGVGAGITADSNPRHEYEECLLKATFASASSSFLVPSSSYRLLETLRLENGSVARLGPHLRRMADSARYFGFVWNDSSVRNAIEEVRTNHPDRCWRLRIFVDRHGVPDVTCASHNALEPRQWRIAYAASAIDDRDPFLFNKTTNRAVYEAARQTRPDVDDVLLWNRRGEVTESTIANIVVELDGERLTPPVECGLLPGIYRAELIETGVLRERVLTRDDLACASRIWLINSLRGWIDAALVP